MLFPLQRSMLLIFEEIRGGELSRLRLNQSAGTLLRWEPFLLTFQFTFRENNGRRREQIPRERTGQILRR